MREGKAALFKHFANPDAWPVYLDTRDVEKAVSIVMALAGVRRQFEDVTMSPPASGWPARRSSGCSRSRVPGPPSFLAFISTGVDTLECPLCRWGAHAPG
ncbi:hypothetical protein FE374_03635 [Georgenia yuyongxinii]|uniref:Uncharacterized protein n=1 Tax=Georgenia yuyongxinii TaxID=2589797 RepID=A0A5B8BZU2_9MICO|nr:hypothetical protein [Georgenia yuyongxinii]QDC23844.1 hypothetical protein FE374_03635 [Georgenia yuyongxinii]